MDDSLDKETPKSFTAKSKLSQYLNLDEKTFDTWVQGPLFQDAFQELLNDCIKPEQEKAEAAHRPRGPSATAVEVAMNGGEAHGECRYSARKINKDGWKMLNHYAYTMYLLISENSTRRQGLFWRKTDRPHMKFCKLWSVLQFMLKEEAPSRKKRILESAEKKKVKERDRLVLAAGSVTPSKKRKTGEDTSISAKFVQESSSDEAEITDDEGSQKGLEAIPQEGLQELQDILQQDIENTEEVQAAGPVTPPKKRKAGENTNISAKFAQESSSDEAEITDDEGSQKGLEANPEEGLQELQDILQQDIEDKEEVQALVKAVQAGGMSIGERLMLERHSKERDLSEAYWQDRLIGELLLQFAQAQLEGEEITDLAHTHDIEDEVMRRAIREAEDDSDLLPFAVATEADFEAYTANSLLQDNSRFHPNIKHEAACRTFYLDPVHPRFECMPLNISFKFWQVVAIAKLREFIQGGLSGALLCDTMGLGKTWEVVGFILAVSFHHPDGN